MSAQGAPALSRPAAAALVEALMMRSGYAFWRNPPALQIHAAREATTRGLLAVLTDVAAREWTGADSGWAFRTYRGTLPCGLLLEVVTLRDEVPDLFQVDGQAQAGLDADSDVAGWSGR